MEQIQVGDWVCWRDYITKKVSGYCQIEGPKKSLSLEYYAVTNSSDGKDGCITKAGAIKCHHLPCGHLVRPFVLEEALAGAELTERCGDWVKGFHPVSGVYGAATGNCSNQRWNKLGQTDCDDINHYASGNSPHDLFLLVAANHQQTLKGDSHAPVSPTGSVVVTEARPSVTNAQAVVFVGQKESSHNARMIERDKPKPVKVADVGTLYVPNRFRENGVIYSVDYCDPARVHGKLDPRDVLVDWEGDR